MKCDDAGPMPNVSFHHCSSTGPVPVYKGVPGAPQDLSRPGGCSSAANPVEVSRCPGMQLRLLERRPSRLVVGAAHDAELIGDARVHSGRGDGDEVGEVLGAGDESYEAVGEWVASQPGAEYPGPRRLSVLVEVSSGRCKLAEGLGERGEREPAGLKRLCVEPQCGHDDILAPAAAGTVRRSQ